MKTCYAISSGSYSDYSVIAIFTTRELAEAELPRYEDAGIEEFPLDPTLPVQYAGLTGFYCRERNAEDQSVYGYDETPLTMLRRDDVGLVRRMGLDGPYYIYLWARDKDHAIKVAAEKFAHQRAIDAGIAI
jgi:hypothetical protein